MKRSHRSVGPVMIAAAADARVPVPRTGPLGRTGLHSDQWAHLARKV